MNLSTCPDASIAFKEVKLGRRPQALIATHATSDGLKILRYVRPGLDRDTHRSLGIAHAKARRCHDEAWSFEVDQACIETFGRPFRFQDYRVSGIACDEFSECRKSTLRQLAHSAAAHGCLSVLHFMAAGHRHQTALRLYREHSGRH